jgi:hypothetical protein
MIGTILKTVAGPIIKGMKGLFSPAIEIAKNALGSEKKPEVDQPMVAKEPIVEPMSMGSLDFGNEEILDNLITYGNDISIKTLDTIQLDTPTEGKYEVQEDGDVIYVETYRNSLEGLRQAVENQQQEIIRIKESAAELADESQRKKIQIIRKKKESSLERARKTYQSAKQFIKAKTPSVSTAGLLATALGAAVATIPKVFDFAKDTKPEDRNAYLRSLAEEIKNLTPEQKKEREKETRNIAGLDDMLGVDEPLTEEEHKKTLFGMGKRFYRWSILKTSKGMEKIAEEMKAGEERPEEEIDDLGMYTEGVDKTQDFSLKETIDITKEEVVPTIKKVPGEIKSYGTEVWKQIIKYRDTVNEWVDKTSKRDDFLGLEIAPLERSSVVPKDTTKVITPSLEKDKEYAQLDPSVQEAVVNALVETQTMVNNMNRRNIPSADPAKQTHDLDMSPPTDTLDVFHNNP